MKRTIGLILFCAAVVFAQSPAAYVQRVVEVKTVDPQTIASALATSSPVKDGYAPQYRVSKELGVITVYGLATDVDRIVANIKELDRPHAGGSGATRNVDVRLYVLVAGNVNLTGEPLPQDLNGVASQLKTVFPFSDIKLLDVAMFRARPFGGMPAGVTGRLPCQAAELPKGTECFYSIDFNVDSVTGANISVERFKFGAQFFGVSGNGGAARQPVDVQGRFDIKAGQKVVIGKSRIDPEGRNLILVLTAQPVD